MSKMKYDENVDHIYCECDSNVSLCGFNISGLDDYGDEEGFVENFCVTCLELETSDATCKYCGK